MDIQNTARAGQIYDSKVGHMAATKTVIKKRSSNPFADDKFEISPKKIKVDMQSLQADLCEAVGQKDEKKLRHCIELGANISAREPKFGFTPIGVAVVGGSDHSFMKTVLEYKPDVNMSMSWRSDKTPLDEATMRADVEMVKMLVDAGASLGDEAYRERMPYIWTTQDPDARWAAPCLIEIRKIFDDSVKKQGIFK